MIFITSQPPLTELKTKSKEEICNTEDLYLFFYKERIYNYIMSDNYYFKSKLHKILENYAQLICMKKVMKYEDMQSYKKEVINQEDKIFREDDIRDMFVYFERNNFRENTICEYVLG